jgi:DNA topoisomerase-6 subunit B
LSSTTLNQPSLFEAVPEKPKKAPAKRAAPAEGKRKPSAAMPLAIEGVPEPDRPAPDAKPSRRKSAEEMGARQRDISVAEFFTKNRHLLGFDSPLKALLTAVKEAVDNSLDAC